MVDDRFLPCCTNRDVLHYTEDSLEFTFTVSVLLLWLSAFLRTTTDSLKSVRSGPTFIATQVWLQKSQ